MSYHIFTPESAIPTGGAEIALFELAPRLASAFPTTIITGDFGQPHRTVLSNITLLASVRLTHQNPITQIINFWNALREANADIYIESVFGKIVFITWLFCKIYKKKFVYMTASDRECDRKNIRRSPFFGQLFKIALEHADIIITSVKHHEQLLRTHHPAISCPILHIPLAMSCIANTIPIQQKKTILWLSRCEPGKNPDLFIELAQQFPHEQFVMIASPQLSQKELFKRIAASATATPNIIFIPGIPHYKTHAYFDQAKILINTSDFEGFSMAFMHSGFAGTPIVTLNLNPDNIITNYNLGYCARGDRELMKRQLQILMRNTEDMQQKSENISAYMRKNHAIETVAEQWERVVARIATS